MLPAPLSDWILPALVGMALGLVAFFVGWFALGMHRRSRYTTEGGLTLLRTLRWREFAALVRELFRSRGYAPSDDHAPAGQGGVDLKLANAEGQLLIRIKHGDSYHVGEKELAELADLIRHHGAAGGVLVTSGHGQASMAHAIAGHPIELLDGERLWNEIRPLLKDEQLDEVRRQTRLLRRSARRRIGAFALTSILLGASATYSAQTWLQPRALANARAGTAAGDPTGPADDAAPDGGTPTTEVVPAAPRPPDRADLERLRMVALEDVRRIGGVTSAEWSTHSTLKVDVVGVAGDKLEATLATVHQEACGVLAGYADLASIRIELHGVDPKNGTEGPARWRLCEVTK